MRKDTLIAIHSDMHSGGTTSLFLNRFWQGQHQNHTPTDKQRAMYKHFVKCAEYARINRKGKRLILVHNGDAVDGRHHDSRQIITYNKEEQKEIHIELMDTFMRRAKFSRKDGDKLFYISGTECHTEDIENEIGKDLRAEKTSDGLFVFDHVEIEINGRLVWFVHHGKERGAGANEGNALRNWLRDIHFEAKKKGARSPDLVVTGHTHAPAYTVYVISDGDGFHLMHGVICPSWQGKTRYAYKAAPVAINDIGAMFVEIKADGEIRTPVILKQETESMQKVTV